jgi:hypothetical protein
MTGPEDGTVHSIGMTELYTEIRNLGDKLSDYINRHDVESSTHAHEIVELRKDLTALETKFETETLRRASASRQAFWAILTSLVFPVLVAVAVLLIANKP